MTKFLSFLQFIAFLLVLGTAAASDGAVISLSLSVLLCLCGGILALTAAVLKNQIAYTRRCQERSRRRTLAAN